MRKGIYHYMFTTILDVILGLGIYIGVSGFKNSVAEGLGWGLGVFALTNFVLYVMYVQTWDNEIVEAKPTKGEE